MNKFLLDNKFLLLFIFLGLILAVVSPVHSQNQGTRSLPQPLCEKKGITFPIKDLGGCKDYFSCRSFCNDPQNTNMCSQFAKEKKITKEEVAETEEFIRFEGKVSVEFGCKGRQACKLVCDNPDNFSTCDKLAKQAKVVGGFIDNPGHKDILSKAEQNLGCTTKNECKAFCEREENREKCSQFASDVGLLGGQQQVGPGSCKSTDTCQAFCENTKNQKECASFGIVKKDVKFPTFESTANQQPGPGGCKSDAECNDYCTKNSSDSACGEYASKYGFKGPGGCSTQDSCAAYCQQNYTDSECAQYGSTYGFKGPGGCSDITSCTSFCTSNYSDPECQKYSGQSGGFKGPGGCSDVASCTSYCTSHFDDPFCQKYIDQSGGQYNNQYEQKKQELEGQYKQQYEQQQQYQPAQ